MFLVIFWALQHCGLRFFSTVSATCKNQQKIVYSLVWQNESITVAFSIFVSVNTALTKDCQMFFFRCFNLFIIVACTWVATVTAIFKLNLLTALSLVWQNENLTLAFSILFSVCTNGLNTATCSKWYSDC